MTTLTVSGTTCIDCGSATYTLGNGMCQECYWSERNAQDATTPPTSDEWDHMILNHYTGR